MKTFNKVVLASTLALLLAACSDDKAPATAVPTGSNDTAQSTEVAQTLSIKHVSGETVVPKNPKRVVVFDFGTLDTFEALDIDVIGLPKANMPAYLNAYNKDEYVDFGTLKEPNFEAIHGAKPDFIVISHRQAPLYEQFSEIAPTINLAIDNSDYLASVTGNMQTLGTIFGKEAAATSEIKAINDKVEKVREQTAAMSEGALILLVNDGKISAYGPGSRFGLIHDVLGFKPADSSIKAEGTHGQTVSFEYVMDVNPDYVFVVDRSAVVGNSETSAKQVVENDLVKNTNAYKNGKIIYLDANVWYLSGGGFKSTERMIDDVQDAINQ